MVFSDFKKLRFVTEKCDVQLQLKKYLTGTVTTLTLGGNRQNRRVSQSSATMAFRDYGRNECAVQAFP